MKNLLLNRHEETVTVNKADLLLFLDFVQEELDFPIDSFYNNHDEVYSLLNKLKEQVQNG